MHAEWVQIWILSSLCGLCSSYRTPSTVSPTTSTTYTPYPKDKQWAEKVMTRHLVNMTTELIRDLQDKFDEASRIEDTYKHTKGYELGYLAAGVQEKFKAMLELYRTYAGLKDFMDAKYIVETMMNAYHVMQGYYNDLKVQQMLYYAVLKKYEAMYASREEYWIILHRNCPADIDNYKKVPDNVLQDVDNVIHNLQSYKVIYKCENNAELKKQLNQVVWPKNTARRQFSHIIMEEPAFNDDVYFKANKVNKWSAKKSQLGVINWPSTSSRSKLSGIDLLEEPAYNDEVYYKADKVKKWSAKSADFKPIEDHLDIDL